MCCKLHQQYGLVMHAPVCQTTKYFPLPCMRPITEWKAQTQREPRSETVEASAKWNEAATSFWQGQFATDGWQPTGAGIRIADESAAYSAIIIHTHLIRAANGLRSLMLQVIWIMIAYHGAIDRKPDRQEYFVINWKSMLITMHLHLKRMLDALVFVSVSAYSCPSTRPFSHFSHSYHTVTLYTASDTSTGCHKWRSKAAARNPHYPNKRNLRAQNMWMNGMCACTYLCATSSTIETDGSS